jgi:hypothetical protein
VVLHWPAAGETAAARATFGRRRAGTGRSEKMEMEMGRVWLFLGLDGLLLGL